MNRVDHLLTVVFTDTPQKAKNAKAKRQIDIFASETNCFTFFCSRKSCAKPKRNINRCSKTEKLKGSAVNGPALDSKVLQFFQVPTGV